MRTTQKLSIGERYAKLAVWIENCRHWRLIRCRAIPVKCTKMYVFFKTLHRRILYDPRRSKRNKHNKITTLVRRCLPLYGGLERPGQSRGDRQWLANGGGHRAAFRFRSVRIFGIGGDFQLDVIVLVEFRQRSSFRSFQSIQQLLNLSGYFPAAGSAGVVLILDHVITIHSISARSPGRLLCSRSVAGVRHVRRLDVAIRVRRVFRDICDVRARRSPSRWSRRRRRVSRRTGAAGIRQSCA